MAERGTSVGNGIIGNPAVQVEAAVSEGASRAGTSAGFLSRSHILDATAACFAVQGYDATTIRAIAARLGCAVGSIYRYFRDKRQLLLACTERVLDPVVKQIERDDADFEQAVRLYVEQASANEQAYRLMFWLAASGKKKGEGELTAEIAEDAEGAYWVGDLPAAVGRIIEAWARRMGDAEAKRRWAVLHGMLMLRAEAEAIVTAIAGAAPVTRAEEPAATAVDESWPQLDEAEEEPAEDITLL